MNDEELIRNSNLEFRKVKSLFFLYEVNENGTILRNVKSKRNIQIRLDMHHSKTGYYAAFVCIKNKVYRVMIHKIVAECWLGEKPEGYEIDHIDRNSRNNDYRNLRYVTHSGQMKNRVLGSHIIAQATKNCAEYIKTISHPVELTTEDGESFSFPSKLQAAQFIAEREGCNPDRPYTRLKKKRSEIFGFQIRYLPRNAETRRDDATA